MNFSPWLALNSDPPDLSSQVAGIKGMSHQPLAGKNCLNEKFQTYSRVKKIER
jgi:hypothetical protein